MLLKANRLMQQQTLYYISTRMDTFQKLLPTDEHNLPSFDKNSIHFLFYLTISVEMHFLANVLISCFQHFHFSVTVIWPGSRRQDTSQVTDVSLSPPPYSVPPLTITLPKEKTKRENTTKKRKQQQKDNL